MKNSTKASVSFIVLLLVLFALYAGTHQQPVNANKTVGGLPLRLTNLTNTTATATPATSIIIATSTARQYVAVVNSGLVDTYLSLGPTAVLGSGILLKASGGSYEIMEENLYTGAISAITSSGTTTFSIVYKQ